MGYVAVLDIQGLTADEYNAIVARMGVETKPAPGIYLHIAAPIEGGMRVVWRAQLLSSGFADNFGGLGGGFAPRQLNR